MKLTTYSHEDLPRLSMYTFMICCLDRGKALPFTWCWSTLTMTLCETQIKVVKNGVPYKKVCA